MYRLNPTYQINQLSANLIMNTNPPTLYSLMNSIVNYDNENPVKIRNLATECHDKIFDFNYPLSSNINKDEFEIQILNHFIMRRINFDTFTAFQIYLENKLNEIMPYYNIILDSLTNYNLFNDGEKITRSLNKEDSGNNSLTTNSTSDLRFAEFPQNKLNNIKDGKYVSNQNYNQSESESSGTNQSTGTENETITRSVANKMTLYKNYLETKNSVMSMIYKDLEILFYQLVD